MEEVLAEDSQQQHHAREPRYLRERADVARLEVSKLQESDHDLIVRIDEKVKTISYMIESDRTNSVARDTKRENEMSNFKTYVEAQLKEIREENESLRMSRAQFFAIAATLSFLFSVGIKLFWK